MKLRCISCFFGQMLLCLKSDCVFLNDDLSVTVCGKMKSAIPALAFLEKDN